MKKYQVIGGQYEKYRYGESDTLKGAKVMASRNKEYWDNWQGWHTPAIYRAEDCREVEAKGMITFADGMSLIIPAEGAEPCSVNINGKWVDKE